MIGLVEPKQTFLLNKPITHYQRRPIINFSSLCFPGSGLLNSQLLFVDHTNIFNHVILFSFPLPSITFPICQALTLHAPRELSLFFQVLFACKHTTSAPRKILVSAPVCVLANSFLLSLPISINLLVQLQICNDPLTLVSFPIHWCILVSSPEQRHRRPSMYHGNVSMTVTVHNKARQEEVKDTTLTFHEQAYVTTQNRDLKVRSPFQRERDKF